MMGRSGSPPSNATSTSHPTRGTISGPLPGPAPAPAQGEATRIQQDDEPSPGGGSLESQGNFTLTRAYLSLVTSPSAGAATVAVSMLGRIGLGVSLGGRNGSPAGMQVNSFR